MTTDEQILELNDLIQVRDNTIAMRDTAIASKDDIISERTALILEYEDTLNQLRAQIADLEANGSGNQGSGSTNEQDIIDMFAMLGNNLNYLNQGSEGFHDCMVYLYNGLDQIKQIWDSKDPDSDYFLFDFSNGSCDLGAFGEWLSDYPVWREKSYEPNGYERYVVEGRHEIGTMIAPTIVFEKSEYYSGDGMATGWLWLAFIGEDGQLPEALQAINGNEYGKYIELAVFCETGNSVPVYGGFYYDLGEEDMTMCLRYPEAFRFMTQSGENLSTDTYNFEVKYYDADCQLLDTTTGLMLENNPKGLNLYFPYCQIDLHKENCKYVVINLSATAISNMCEYSVDDIPNSHGYATQFTGAQFLVYDGSGVYSYAKMDDPWYSAYNSLNGYSQPYVGVDDPDFPESCIIFPGYALPPCVMVSSRSKIVMGNGDSMYLASEKYEYGYKYPKYDFLIDKYDLDVTAAQNDDEVKQLILDRLESKVMLPVETSGGEKDYEPAFKYDDGSAIASHMLTIENIDGQWVSTVSEDENFTEELAYLSLDTAEFVFGSDGYTVGNLVNLDATVEENSLVVRPHQPETFRWLTEYSPGRYAILCVRTYLEEYNGENNLTCDEHFPRFNFTDVNSQFDPQFILEAEQFTTEEEFEIDGVMETIEFTCTPVKYEIVVVVQNPNKNIVCPDQDCFAISNTGDGEFCTSETAWAGGAYSTEYTTEFQDYMPVAAGEEVAFTGDEVRFVTMTGETVKHHGQLDSIAALLNVNLTDNKDENETLLAAAVQNLMGE